MWLAIVPLLCMPSSTTAAQTVPDPTTATEPASKWKTPDASNAIVYKPPVRGAPAQRVGGGTRGVSVVPVLTVLAPDHVALTTSEQPTLYWYVSAPSVIRIEVALVDPAGVKPLIKTSLPNVEPGIHRFNLKDFNVRLKPNEEYQWSVSSVVSDKQRSREIVSGSTFRLTELPSNIRGSVAMRDKDQQAIAYAAHGIWHDALDALSESIRSAPDRRELRNMRGELLEQAGLRAAADFERRAAQ